MSSVRPERAGFAAATSETGYELGTTLGTAVLGGVLVARYSRVVAAEIEVVGLPRPLRERASSTTEAQLVGAEVDATTAASVLQIAESAFTDAIIVTGVTGALIMVPTASWAAVTLRGAAPNRDLAADLEHEVAR